MCMHTHADKLVRSLQKKAHACTKMLPPMLYCLPGQQECNYTKRCVKNEGEEKRGRGAKGRRDEGEMKKRRERKETLSYQNVF